MYLSMWCMSSNENCTGRDRVNIQSIERTGKNQSYDPGAVGK